MKIHERYSIAEKMFMGKGFWIVFLPLRFLLSLFFISWLKIKWQFNDNQTGLLKRKNEVSKVKDLSSRVISVGNIVVGGGGKTPCVIAIAEEIKRNDGMPVVITRGYGSLAEKVKRPIVISKGINLNCREGDYLTEADFADERESILSDRLFARRFGDEVSIYKQLGISVVIDFNRARGAELADKLLNPTDILLDDAYQNKSLKKDKNILLLDYKLPFDGGRVLPLGSLREKPEAVKRADLIIFTRAEGEEVPPEVSGLIRGKRVYFSRHEFCCLYGRNGQRISPWKLKQRRLVLYSGIAFHASFEDMVSNEISIPSASFRYSDHYRYNKDDIESMITEAGKGACYLTTEKDWFKTHELFPESIELYAVSMKMVFRKSDLREICSGD
ncbi:MAG: tetraacyldisaccharide 4'-kinase [Candidatus Krumholzibacteriota bacterium]|nr:tetraacyldisaccharide 4'-kinase [Candidatus Krumholzibacteriota bacterium]